MKNFSISVCFFHLNQTLAESLDRVSPKADLIWENLIKLSEKLPFNELKDFKCKLACYQLDEESNVFKHKTEALNLINLWLTKEQQPIALAAINQNGLSISGNLQPFLLHDTYAFDLTLSATNYDQDITVEELYLFEPSSLFLDFSENTLGETIWFYGETEVADAECQALADKLVTSFLKNTKFTARLVNEGSLLKIPLFEYEISQENQPNQLYKILIWINNQAINPEIDPVYDYLFGALWTRHKIEYFYQQGRESYSQARKVYSALEAKIKEFKQDLPLEELQKLLESIPELSIQYQRQLRNLQGHYTTIKSNQGNYQKDLQNFWQTGDISTWQEFGEITCKRYLDQIEIYLSYIQPGKDLIGEFINTLRGLVEIEQAKSDRQLQQTLQYKELEEKKRDRNLQNTIQAVGTGIGVGVGGAGIVAAGYPLIEKPWDFPSPQHPLLPPHPFIIAVVLSCLSGGGFGWLAWFVTKRYLNRKSSNQQTSLPSPQNQLPSEDG
jgi:predicted house-cleaning noncanonical NTP pyrophosphatase (MazG superfamily)